MIEFLQMRKSTIIVVATKIPYGKSSVQKNPVWEKLVAKKVEYGKVTPPKSNLLNMSQKAGFRLAPIIFIHANYLH